MHELGLICKVVERVAAICDEQNIPKVASITLEIGELSGIVPEYMERCFPAVIYDKPRFLKTKLIIDIVEGIAECDKCHTCFNVIKHEGYCPHCHSFDKRVLSGLDFIVKEIAVPEE